MKFPFVCRVTKPSVIKTTLASFVALMTGGAPLIIYTQSQFLGPMTSGLEWSRSQYFLPLSISGLLACGLMPIVGRMADRYGVRRILLPSIVLFAISYGALGVTGASYTLYALFLGAAMIFQVPYGVMLYTKLVSLWPMRHPGLMLAVTLAGSAAGAILAPPLAEYLIDNFGWQVARGALAILIMAISFPVTFFFVMPPPTLQDNDLKTALFGISVQQAIGLREFWLVLLILGLSSLAMHGILGNAVPIFMDRGISRAAAALSISLVAGTQLAARFLTGALLDRVQTPRIGLPALLSGLLAFIILGCGAQSWQLVVGMVCLGVALGAELELGSYFIRKYFGTRNYAQLYGYMLAAYGIGASTGPLIVGYSFDASGNYVAGIATAATLMSVAIACLMLMRPYQHVLQSYTVEAGPVASTSGRMPRS